MPSPTRELFRKRLSLELAITRAVPKRVGFRPSEDTPKLLQIVDDQQFVEAAYLTILGRDADDAGLAGYMDALRNKTPRRDVIKRMAASDEAKAWSNLDNEESLESAGKLPMMQRLREGVVGKARHVLNQLLLSRFDSIDFRLAFLLNNLAERDQNLSKKLDDSIKVLSEKLDARLASGPPEAGVMKLWKSLVKPGMIVLDVGANTGAFTLAAASIAAKVHSFEPDAHIQHPAGANVVFHPEAVTDGEGTATLATFPDQTSRNTLFWPVRGLNSLSVRTTTIDAALDGEPRADLAIIDVEGAEAQVLRGMKRTLAANPQIQILLAFSPNNLHRAGVDPAEFLQQVRALGRPLSKVDPAKGDLHETSDAELLSGFSAFLHLGTSK